MLFNIVFRNREGRPETTQLEASSRADVFAQLAQKGVKAIRVDEAKGKLKPKKPAERGVPKLGLRLAVWGVIGLAVAIAAYFKAADLGDDAGRQKRTDRKPDRIAEATPSAVAQPTADATKPKTAHDIAEEFNEQAKAFVKKAVTNETQWIVPPLDPKDPDNALRTRVCQELGSLLSIEPGEPMPPFPYSFLLEDDMRQAAAEGEDVGEIDNGNKAFLDSLAKYKIVAKETDDAQRLEHKERLIAAQGELLDSMGEGLSVNDTIRAAYEFRKQAYETRTELCGLLTEMAQEKDADIKIFKEQLEIANARLKEQGIKTIPLEEILPDYEDAHDEGEHE